MYVYIYIYTFTILSNPRTLNSQHLKHSQTYIHTLQATKRNPHWSVGDLRNIRILLDYPQNPSGQTASKASCPQSAPLSLR